MRILLAVFSVLLLAGPAWARPWLTEAQIQELAGDDFEALSAVCDGNFYVPNKTLLKSALSGHIPLGDWRRADKTNGSCSLVGGTLPKSVVQEMIGGQGTFPLIAINGQKFATFRRYDVMGYPYRFRYYTTNNQCKRVSARGVAKSGKKAGCVRWANGCSCAQNIIGRTGDVK